MWAQVCSFKRLLPPVRLIRISKLFENFALRTLNGNEYLALRTLYWEESVCDFWVSKFQYSSERKNPHIIFFWSKKKSGQNNSDMPSFKESTVHWQRVPHASTKFSGISMVSESDHQTYNFTPQKLFQCISKEKVTWHPNTNSLNFQIYLGTGREII